MTSLDAIYDASAIIPFMVNNPCTQAANAVRQVYRPMTLSFAYAELANALSRIVRFTDYTQTAAETALSAVRNALLDEPFEPYLNEALALAISHQHSAYDCLYVAAARSRAVPLVTADKRLAAKFADHLDGNILNLYDLPEDLT